MSVTFNHIVTNRLNVDQNAYAVPTTLTPNPNRLMIGVVTSQHASLAPNIPSISAGGITTWSVYQEYNRPTTRRMSIHYGLTGSSPGSAQPVIDFAGQTQSNCEWSFFEADGCVLTGVNGIDAFVQFAEHQSAGNQTSYNIPLAALFGPGSAAVGAYFNVSARTITAQSPSVLLGTVQGINENATLATVYSNTTTPTAEFVGTASGWYGISFELKALSDMVLPIVQRAPYASGNRGFSRRLGS